MASRAPARVLSGVLIVAGACLTLVPVFLIIWTLTRVGPMQAAALAAWEDGATSGQRAAPAGRTAGRPGPASQGLVLTIPRLGLKRYVPEGASLEQLRRYGVGRISWTALPADGGIVGIAGHRTTYGAPFFRLDRLGRGDLILIDSAGKRFAYTVTERLLVRPSQVEVLRGSPGQRGIALVTCAPLYSAAYRLVILGRLHEISAIPPAP